LAVDKKRLLAAVVLCEAAGVLGSVFTIPAVSSWYLSTQKPAFTPPNWAFGPVWLILFLLMGFSLYWLWEKHAKGPLLLFGLQLASNVLWTFFFFGLRQYLVGLFDIAALWVLIAATMVAAYKTSRRASLILVPYLAWVTVALALNYYVWLLNPISCGC
jgi:tryptophan-rich sensory protein